MSATRREDLSEILTAIREVEANLDRRGARATGVTMMAWGVAASSIFLFYHLVEGNPGPWLDLLGRGGIRWFWVGPSALAYLASAFVGARLGRIGDHARAARKILRLLLALLAPFAVLVYVSVTGDGDAYMPGMWVLFLGVTLALWCRDQASRLRHVYLAASLVSFGHAAVLLALAPEWGNLAAGVHYAIALAGTGAAKYHAEI